jgi:hypothetical protein
MKRSVKSKIKGGIKGAGIGLLGTAVVVTLTSGSSSGDMFTGLENIGKAMTGAGAGFVIGFIVTK